MKVEIFTTPDCGYCQQAKLYLQHRGVDYTEHDVSVDESAARRMVSLSGQMGVPVILIEQEVIIGFNRRRIDELLDTRSSSTGGARLGASVADASSVARRYNLDPVPGALVGNITPGSPAYTAGLREGDIIQEFNRQPVEDAHSLQSILLNTPAGTYTSIVFVRTGRRMAAEIRL